MKKILYVVIFCLLLTGCSQAVDKDTKKDKQANVPVEKGSLQYLNAARGNGNEKGYYRISDMIEKEKQSYVNIRYIDFASKKEIVLCNKPECKHDNDSCNAYISQEQNINPVIYVHGDYLYLFKQSMDANTVSFGDNGKIENSDKNKSTLERMDLDGTNRRTITSWDEESLTNDFAFNNRYMYMKVDITASKESISGTLSYNKESYIQQIDLTTGEKKKILDAKNLQLHGVYKNKLLFTKYHYDKDPNDLLDNDEAYLENARNAKVEIMSYDPAKGKEEVYAKLKSNDIYSSVLIKDTFYYNKSSDPTLYAIHLDTKKQEEVMQLPADSKSSFLVDVLDDDILRLDFYDEKEVNSSLTKSYFIDLKTKQAKPYSLYTNDLHLPIDILSETKDSYFVIYDYTAPKKYIEWANTYQADIERTFYGLIKKEDYRANKAKYTRIKEIK